MKMSVIPRIIGPTRSRSLGGMLSDFNSVIDCVFQLPNHSCGLPELIMCDAISCASRFASGRSPSEQ